MGEQSKTQKNHWTQTKIDNATKKINQDIYKRNRQAPIHIKMDVCNTKGYIYEG